MKILRAYHTLLWIVFFVIVASTGLQAQNTGADTTDVEVVQAPPTVEELQNYNKYEDEEYDEDSALNAKANAFELLDTVAQQKTTWRKQPAGFTDKLLKDDAFGYVKNGIPKPKEKNFKPPLFKIWLILLIISIIAFVAFLVWYLGSNNIALFRKRAASLPTTTNTVDEKDIFSINYQNAIQAALRDKNYRLAIRLQYLHVLKIMSDKGIIHYQPDKTNFEYLLQLRPTAYYNEFFKVTRNYEYSWYGLFDITAEKYEQIENDFSEFQKRII